MSHSEMSAGELPIRVVIADDAPVVRRVLRRVLDRDPEIEVADAFAQGAPVLARVMRDDVDLLVLDLDMPEFDGVATLRALRELRPEIPVILFTGADRKGLEEAKSAFLGGQLRHVAKGVASGDGLSELVATLPAVVKRLMGRAPGMGVAHGTIGSGSLTVDRARSVGARRARVEPLVAIGSSTGGPNALSHVLSRLPADFAAPLAIVQHMPETFTARLADRLNAECPMSVREARHGEPLQAGVALLAPGGIHMGVERTEEGAFVRLVDAPPENSCRPSVDLLFRDVAAAYGRSAMSVVLTGMGQDGLGGARAIREAGGTVVVQDEETSVVWGMPGAIARASLAHDILPLEGMAAAIDLWAMSTLRSRKSA